MSRPKKEHPETNEYIAEAEENPTIAVDKDKVFRLAYRLVTRPNHRMPPTSARLLVEDLLRVRWEEIKQYISEHPK